MSYLPHTRGEREAMLAAIGVSSVEDLFANVPTNLRSGQPNIPAGLSELEVLRLIGGLASQDVDLETHVSFLGAGAYNHYIPAVVGAMTGRSEFYTSYTPYQPEVSQGTLQVIYEYQTMIAELTGLDISNASLYDAATAVAEASTIAINESRRERIAIAGGVHPEYREVLQTYVNASGFELVVLPERSSADVDAFRTAIDGSVAGLIVQSPNFWGGIEPMSELTEIAPSGGAQMIAVCNPLSLALLAPPGEYGAGIAVGCAQPFGIPLMYGGPYLGYIAVRSGLERRLPGRIAGRTVDATGREGFVLTLQAREQHIRRERATSNICTNQAHCALIATIYLALMGKTGLRAAASANLRMSRELAQRVAKLEGYRLKFSAPYFNEIVLDCGRPAAQVLDELGRHGILGGIDLGRHYPELAGCILMAATELTTSEQIDALCAALDQVPNVLARV